MRKIKLTVLLFFSALMLSAQTERPKLVVGLVVDQMRWDYLYYYYDKFGEGGLKRLVDEGYSFENTMINYVPTITAIGHSSIYTGSVPALTGITGNAFYVDGQRMYCCEDSTAKTVGSNTKAGMMSPRNMLASTMGDMLKIATDFKSKVIGVALKDRASILPAGHSADAAYWYDEEAGHFITSTYYMNELPKWVKEFNEKNNTKPGFDIKTSNLGVTMTFRMAEAALENENLGSDEVTDLLAVSVSSTDAIGHEYGTRGKENYDVYMQLDKDMAHFFKMLDEKVGRNNYLLFLTADHGAAHNPNFLKSHKIPSGGWESRSVRTKLNEHLKETFKTTSNLVVGISSYKVYLNHKNIHFVVSESGQITNWGAHAFSDFKRSNGFLAQRR